MLVAPSTYDGILSYFRIDIVSSSDVDVLDRTCRFHRYVLTDNLEDRPSLDFLERDEMNCSCACAAAVVAVHRIVLVFVAHFHWPELLISGSAYVCDRDLHTIHNV